MAMRIAAPAAAILFGLAGCANNRVAHFAQGSPSMAPPDWMVGTVDGYGIVVDRFGHIATQFRAHEVGHWDSARRTLTLVEHITYPQGDGKPQDRIWHFVEHGKGEWTGTANDVLGTAHAEQAGNAWHLQFDQMLPVGGSRIAVAVDDWRLREAGDVAVDYSTLSKLGVTLATAEIAFVKRAKK